MFSIVRNTEQKHLGEERVPWLALSGHSPSSRSSSGTYIGTLLAGSLPGPCSVSLLIQLEPTHLKMVLPAVGWALSHQDHPS